MTHTSKTRQWQTYSSPLGTFLQAGMLGLLVTLLYVGTMYWNLRPDDLSGWRAADVLGPDAVPRLALPLRVYGNQYSGAIVGGGELPIPFDEDLANRVESYLQTFDRAVGRRVLVIEIERDTRVADLAAAFDAYWRAGIDEGAFLVRKTLNYSILAEQKVTALRFPLTRNLGRYLDRAITPQHDALSSPCGVFEVMRDEAISADAPFERLARAMVRCRARFPHI